MAPLSCSVVESQKASCPCGLHLILWTVTLWFLGVGQWLGENDMADYRGLTVFEDYRFRQSKDSLHCKGCSRGALVPIHTVDALAPLPPVPTDHVGDLISFFNVQPRES